MLNKDCKFPTIGKEPLQVCEMILWGPAPPFYADLVISIGYKICVKNFVANFVCI